jgi:hypothetical protein
VIGGIECVGGFVGAIVVESALAPAVAVLAAEAVLAVAPSSSVAAAGWVWEPGPARVLGYSDDDNAAVVDNNVLVLALPLFPIPLLPVDVVPDNVDLVRVATLVGFPPRPDGPEADHGTSGARLIIQTDEDQQHRPAPSSWSCGVGFAGDVDNNTLALVVPDFCFLAK